MLRLDVIWRQDIVWLRDAKCWHMTEPKENIVALTFRLPEHTRNELMSVLAKDGRKMQWLIETFVAWFLKSEKLPWEDLASDPAMVPASIPDAVGHHDRIQSHSEIISTLESIQERSPVMARALRAIISATATELLIGKADANARVPDHATIERLAQEPDQAVRDAEQAVARSKANRRPIAKRTG
jgi:hypothetical protein